MLREVFKRQLEERFSSNSFFSLYDFSIDEDKPKENQVNIIYLPDSKYHFNFIIPDSKTEIKEDYGSENKYVYNALIAPWQTAEIEKVKFYSKDAFLNGIDDWLKYLEEDLLSKPVNRKIKHFEEQLNEFIVIIEDFDDKYFTEEEAKNLEDKINEIQQAMISNINQLNKKTEEKENMISELKLEIEALKKKIDIFDKKGMFKSFVAKIFQWTTKPENQKLIGDGVSIVKNLIENRQ